MEHEHAETYICPTGNDRCTKLARKVLMKLMAGKESVKLDPVLWGVTWRFSPDSPDQPSHYDHINTAVNDAGISAERDDTLRLRAIDLESRYTIRRTNRSNS